MGVRDGDGERPLDSTAVDEDLVTFYLAQRIYEVVRR